MEIKKCPFCGSNASLRQKQVTVKKYNPIKYNPIMSVPDYSIGYNSKKSVIEYKVVCNKCKASVGLYSRDKTAIEA